ncbi:MAG: UDP-GlcNAc:undecaprenyl-phosphate/decaprenyl-phosphate GlcNAc-phosphate transferase [Thermoleophilaceae bacterium]|nr:UDP-GlcNAc:undecaprenyl-phosphate/decaprenyl-phosphate GlcNAc-phosphate transferase [Thermoleophilaceae bacterium]
MNELEAVAAFAVAAVVTLVMTPQTGRLAVRVGAIDLPRDRSLHEAPVPRLGGLAILAGLLVAAAAFMPWSAETRGILGGAIAIGLVGALDDVRDLPPPVKLALQVAAAAIPVAAGVRVEVFTLPFLGSVELGATGGGILTGLGMVAVMNVVNFTDGVDGLAAGVCTISGATFAVIALSLDRVDAGVLAALTAGAALGFLWHNFHPASVFMGDAGSNLLGLMLACIAVQGVLKTAAVVALVFPLVVLAVPILDTAFVVAKRFKYRRPAWQADAEHFHHRMARIGFSQRRTVIYLYLWTLALAALALALRFVPYSDDHGNFDTGWTLVMVAFGMVAVAASVYLVYVLEILKFRRFRERQLAKKEGITQAEIDAEIEREMETGEFPAVRLD